MNVIEAIGSTQKAYERIRAYFSKPGARIAVNDFGECVYRAQLEDGAVVKCAIGCLIPDGVYTSSIENVSLVGILDNATGIPPDTRRDLNSLFQGVDLTFLAAAQNSHDQSNPADGGAGFVRSLDILAEQWDLEVVS